MLRVLDGVAKKYGVNVIVEDTISRSYEKDGRVYSAKGNGYYDPSDGSIHIALDAEENAYMFVAVHELTHLLYVYCCTIPQFLF